MDFGTGLNIIDNTIISNNPCLKDINISNGIKRNSYSFNIQKIESKNDLIDIFELGFNINMKVGMWGVEASGNFVDNFEFNSNNYYIAVSMNIEGTDYNLLNPTMSEKALNLYSTDYD